MLFQYSHVIKSFWGRFAQVLSPIVLFIILRAIIYWIFPIESQEDWIRVDLIKNIPRMLCLGLALYLAKPFWINKIKTIFGFEGWFKAATYLALISIFSWINGFWNPPGVFSNQEIIVITIGSICVAAFEEVTFRLLLLETMLEKFKKETAIICSSLIFMIFHIQAQPAYTWPYLFFAGVQFSVLKLMGVSITSLIIVHATYDTVIFYLASGRWNAGYIIYEALNLALALFYWWEMKNEKRV